MPHFGTRELRTFVRLKLYQAVTGRNRPPLLYNVIESSMVCVLPLKRKTSFDLVHWSTNVAT